MEGAGTRRVRGGEGAIAAGCGAGGQKELPPSAAFPCPQQLLRFLQEFSQQTISRTHEIKKQVDGLISETKAADCRLHNVFNDFLMLSNTQFIENVSMLVCGVKLVLQTLACPRAVTGKNAFTSWQVLV